MNDPGIWIIAALVIAFALSVIDAARKRGDPDDPKTVLHRCKIELAAVRAEIMKVPASRDVHKLLADIDRTDLLIDETAARYD